MEKRKQQSDNSTKSNVAVAEKLAALRTERYFRERMARARPEDFREILERAGEDVSIEGDELEAFPPQS